MRFPGFNTRIILSFFSTATLLLTAVIAFSSAAFAQTISTAAKHAILIDAGTNSVLFQKEADDPIPPASISKLMTMAVLFDAIKAGEVSLDDEFFISEDAWRRGGANSGGSTMFAKLNDTIRVEDLMRGVIVQSGNDASIAIAENMAGVEASFAGRMTEFAREIGLKTSTFMNATGLPDEGHVMTAREMAILAKHLIEEYPDFYPIYSETEFEWNGINQFNRNPLLRMSIGADGLKTGFTQESGYSLVGSAVQNGQRLIVVVTGLPTRQARANEARKLLTWGFRSFDSVTLFGADETVGHATVFGGSIRRLPLDGDGEVQMLRPRGDRGRLRGRIVYRGPLMAPIDAGTPVATLQVESDERLILETPLYASVDVPIGPLHRRAMDALYELGAGFIFGGEEDE